MPLVKGQKARTRAGFSENIRREMDALFLKSMTYMFQVF